MKPLAAALVIGALAWCAFLQLAGCVTPKAGTPCPASDSAYCTDAGVARACKAGVLVDYACRGPKGCVVDSSRNVLCDQSMHAGGGDGCFPDYEGKGQCSQDGNSVLQCTNGLWMAVACPQALKCHVDPEGVLCR